MTSKRKMIDCKLTKVLNSRTNRDIPQSQFIKSRIFEFWWCFVASNYPSHTWQLKLIVSAKWYRRYNSKWSADTRYNYHHCLKGDCLPPWRCLPPGVFMVLLLSHRHGVSAVIGQTGSLNIGIFIAIYCNTIKIEMISLWFFGYYWIFCYLCSNNEIIDRLKAT